MAKPWSLLSCIEPLGVDEGLENPADFELVMTPVETAQETHVDDAVQVGVDAVHQAGLVDGIGHENAHHFDDVLAAEDQSCVAAGGVEPGQLLAQQCDQQADRITELAARDQAWQFRLAVLRLALAQIGETFGFIND